MKTIRQAVTCSIFAIAISCGTVGTGIAADLYTLPTEDGVELFLLDNHLETPVLDLRGTSKPSLTVGQTGELTFARPDSLTKHFGVENASKTSAPSVTYQGFRTSPLGRVLNVEGRFQPDLGTATMETASGQLPERHFDLGTPTTGRGGWQEGQGLHIFSF